MDRKWGVVAGDWKISSTTWRTSALACAPVREENGANAEEERYNRRCHHSELLVRRRISRMVGSVSFCDGWTLLSWPWRRQSHVE